MGVCIGKTKAIAEASAISTPMDTAKENNDDIEEIADILLLQAGALDPDNGIYTQHQLDRKIRKEQRRTPYINESEVSNDVLEYLLQKQLDDLIDAARLTALQEISFRLYVSGFTLQDMAKVLGIGSGSVSARLRLAKIKMRAAYKDGKYAGWYEVYLSEIRRGTHNK